MNASTSYWLTLALITQVVAAVLGAAQGDAGGQSLFSWGVIGIVLLVLARRGHEWARVAFLTVSIWGLGMLALLAISVQFIPSATIDFNWPDVVLTSIAIAACIKAKRSQSHPPMYR